MFHALTGHFVHSGGTTLDRLVAAMKKPAPPLASVVEGLPDSVEALVDRSLMFAKEDRWPDARSMQQAVRAAFAEITGRRDTSPDRVSLSRVPGFVPVPAVDSVSLDVSVTFDPELSQSVETLRDEVTPSMIEEVVPVTDSMLEEPPKRRS